MLVSNVYTWYMDDLLGSFIIEQLVGRLCDGARMDSLYLDLFVIIFCILFPVLYTMNCSKRECALLCGRRLMCCGSPVILETVFSIMYSTCDSLSSSNGSSASHMLSIANLTISIMFLIYILFMAKTVGFRKSESNTEPMRLSVVLSKGAEALLIAIVHGFSLTSWFGNNSYKENTFIVLGVTYALCLVVMLGTFVIIDMRAASSDISDDVTKLHDAYKDQGTRQSIELSVREFLGLGASGQDDTAGDGNGHALLVDALSKYGIALALSMAVPAMNPGPSNKSQ